LSAVTGTLKVHFIDVGQGDSILIQTPGHGDILIDAGDSSQGSAVVSYLKDQGVSELAWLIATHPHADHIGGMIRVLSSFPVRNMSMPRASHTTQTYENLLIAIKNKGLTVVEARAGRSILEAGNLRAYFMSPTTASYDDLNDWSAVLKLQYGTTSFLFAGDAGTKPEGEMLLSSARQPKAHVLKVAHHGSAHATGAEFLKAVSPKYAVISVGSGNPYGYPVKATLDRLVAQKVKVYRTDVHGSVVITSDGQTLSVKTQKSG
jgi:competence protein ComEC